MSLFISYFTRQLEVKLISGRMSGIRHAPDIRHPAFVFAGYPAGRISGIVSILYIPSSYTGTDSHCCVAYN
jgi:hypothetical protein